MPSLPISGSPNIDTLDFKTVFDLVSGNIKIDLSPTVWKASGASNVTGAKIKLTSPTGVELKDGTVNDFTPPMASTIEVLIPKTGGIYNWGLYIIEITLEEVLSGIKKTYTLKKTYRLCPPNPKDLKSNTGVAKFLMEPHCIAGFMSVSGGDGYSYSGKGATLWTKNITFYYPTDTIPHIANIDITPFDVKIYTGKSIVKGASIGTFDFNDNFQAIVKFIGEESKDVRCNMDFCKLYCELAKLMDILESEKCGTTAYREAENKITAATKYINIILLGVDCDHNVDSYITALEKILGIDCGCGCSDSSGQLINQSAAPASKILIDGCGVSSQLIGTTIKYTINARTYQLILRKSLHTLGAKSRLTINTIGDNGNALLFKAVDGNGAATTIAAYTKTGADLTTTAIATAIKDSINTGTPTHGYSATVNENVVEITAPISSSDNKNGVQVLNYANNGTLAWEATVFSGGVYSPAGDISLVKEDVAGTCNSNLIIPVETLTTEIINLIKSDVTLLNLFGSIFNTTVVNNYINIAIAELLDAVDPKCVATADQWAAADSKEKLQFIIDYICGGGLDVCNAAVITSGLPLPTAYVGVPYNHSVYLGGTAPFALSAVTKPAWLTLTLVDEHIEFTGTPTDAGDSEIGFTVSNCFEGSLVITAEALHIENPCVPAQINGNPVLPNAVYGVPYSFVINLLGTGPFNFYNPADASPVIKPSWMNINIVGNQVQITGNPPSGHQAVSNVSFAIANGCGNDSFAGTIAVTTNQGCTPASIASGLPLPDAIIGQAYNHTITFNGTAPFNVSDNITPWWMNVGYTSNGIVLTGTPYQDDAHPPSLGTQNIGFKVTNCNNEILNISTPLDVVLVAQFEAFWGRKADGANLTEPQIEASADNGLFNPGDYIAADYSAGVAPEYLWMAEPATEPVKTSYQSGLFSGGIGNPGDLFAAPVVIGAKRFYITNYATQANIITFKY